MAKFRLIASFDAFQITNASRAERDTWPQWLKDAHLNDKAIATTGGVFPVDYPNSDGTDQLRLEVSGETGGMGGRVAWGDWIVRDADGQLSLCPADRFTAIYEPA